MDTIITRAQGVVKGTAAAEHVHYQNIHEDRTITYYYAINVLTDRGGKMYVDKAEDQATTWYEA